MGRGGRSGSFLDSAAQFCGLGQSPGLGFHACVLVASVVIQGCARFCVRECAHVCGSQGTASSAGLLRCHPSYLLCWLLHFLSVCFEAGPLPFWACTIRLD